MFEMSEAHFHESQDGLTVEDSMPRDTTKNPLGLDFLGSMPPQTVFGINEKPKRVLDQS